MTHGQIKYFSSLKDKKTRDTERKFLVEGFHLIEECLSSKIYKDKILKIICRKDVNEKKLSELSKYPNLELEFVEDEDFSRLSETMNSQGITAIVEKSDEKIKHNENLILGLDIINDPGNMGTIIRTAYWFGVYEVIINKNSVDVFNSKVLRASQGAVFHLNIQTEVDLEFQIEKRFTLDKYKVILSSPKSKKTLDKVIEEVDDKTIIVFGNESTGISKGILGNKKYLPFKIKGFSDCESLNVGVAVGIVLNEVRKKFG